MKKNNGNIINKTQTQISNFFHFSFFDFDFMVLQYCTVWCSPYVRVLSSQCGPRVTLVIVRECSIITVYRYR